MKIHKRRQALSNLISKHLKGTNPPVRDLVAYRLLINELEEYMDNYSEKTPVDLIDIKFKVRVKPNTIGKMKWYYKKSDDRVGKEYIVTVDLEPSMMAGRFRYTDALFFHPDDVEILEVKPLPEAVNELHRKAQLFDQLQYNLKDWTKQLTSYFGENDRSGFEHLSFKNALDLDTTLRLTESTNPYTLLKAENDELKRLLYAQYQLTLSATTAVHEKKFDEIRPLWNKVNSKTEEVLKINEGANKM
ncbi:hypothetical protein M1M30_gp159 [Maribacter phage Colly_1]|uniref:Uncharacterized protein n=1 Tax=Maribacter phage Colly_1 TaxID=2745691 RepID=A0A8E4UXV7_9CAUD|nr:hypothetical protein M1M30_gp159 [Maribacter phage Colly_1]QQO97261.1 hypothetical protein Colly1_159 [Maribacter phage Colly_1]